jgi:hypothetical protein
MGLVVIRLSILLWGFFCLFCSERRKNPQVQQAASVLSKSNDNNNQDPGGVGLGRIGSLI